MATLVLPVNTAYTPAEIEQDPARKRSMQQGRSGFLFSGGIEIEDGFVTDDEGHTTTYALLRPFVFTDPSVPNTGSQIPPGTDGMRPLNFVLGAITVVGPQTRNVLLTSSL